LDLVVLKVVICSRETWAEISFSINQDRARAAKKKESSSSVASSRNGEEDMKRGGREKTRLMASDSGIGMNSRSLALASMTANEEFLDQNEFHSKDHTTSDFNTSPTYLEATSVPEFFDDQTTDAEETVVGVSYYSPGNSEGIALTTYPQSVERDLRGLGIELAADNAPTQERPLTPITSEDSIRQSNLQEFGVKSSGGADDTRSVNSLSSIGSGRSISTFTSRNSNNHLNGNGWYHQGNNFSTSLMINKRQIRVSKSKDVLTEETVENSDIEILE
jgi:hypothetical protein